MSGYGHTGLRPYDALNSEQVECDFTQNPLTVPGAIHQDDAASTVIALYDYVDDPNNQHALFFRKGDVITVTEKRDDGWWGGILNGEEGFFPATYVSAAATAMHHRTATDTSQYGNTTLLAAAAAYETGSTDDVITPTSSSITPMDVESPINKRDSDEVSKIKKLTTPERDCPDGCYDVFPPTGMVCGTWEWCTKPCSNWRAGATVSYHKLLRTCDALVGLFIGLFFFCWAIAGVVELLKLRNSTVLPSTLTIDGLCTEGIHMNVALDMYSDSYFYVELHSMRVHAKLPSYQQDMAHLWWSGNPWDDASIKIEKGKNTILFDGTLRVDDPQQLGWALSAYMNKTIFYVDVYLTAVVSTNAFIVPLHVSLPYQKLSLPVNDNLIPVLGTDGVATGDYSATGKPQPPPELRSMFLVTQNQSVDPTKASLAAEAALPYPESRDPTFTRNMPLIDNVAVYLTTNWTFYLDATIPVNIDILGKRLDVAPIPLRIMLPELYLDVQDMNGTYMATGHINPLAFDGVANATLDAYIRQDLSDEGVQALAGLTQAYINKKNMTLLVSGSRYAPVLSTSCIMQNVLQAAPPFKLDVKQSPAVLPVPGNTTESSSSSSSSGSNVDVNPTSSTATVTNTTRMNASSIHLTRLSRALLQFNNVTKNNNTVANNTTTTTTPPTSIPSDLPKPPSYAAYDRYRNTMDPNPVDQVVVDMVEIFGLRRIMGQYQPGNTTYDYSVLISQTEVDIFGRLRAYLNFTLKGYLPDFYLRLSSKGEELFELHVWPTYIPSVQDPLNLNVTIRLLDEERAIDLLSADKTVNDFDLMVTGATQYNLFSRIFSKLNRSLNSTADNFNTKLVSGDGDGNTTVAALAGSLLSSLNITGTGDQTKSLVKLVAGLSNSFNTPFPVLVPSLLLTAGFRSSPSAIAVLGDVGFAGLTLLPLTNDTNPSIINANASIIDAGQISTRAKTIAKFLNGDGGLAVRLTGQIATGLGWRSQVSVDVYLKSVSEFNASDIADVDAVLRNDGTAPFGFAGFSILGDGTNSRNPVIKIPCMFPGYACAYDGTMESTPIQAQIDVQLYPKVLDAEGLLSFPINVDFTASPLALAARAYAAIIIGGVQVSNVRYNESSQIMSVVVQVTPEFASLPILRQIYLDITHGYTNITIAASGDERANLLSGLFSRYRFNYDVQPVDRVAQILQLANQTNPYTKFYPLAFADYAVIKSSPTTATFQVNVTLPSNPLSFDIDLGLITARISYRAGSRLIRLIDFSKQLSITPQTKMLSLDLAVSGNNQDASLCDARVRDSNAAVDENNIKMCILSKVISNVLNNDAPLGIPLSVDITYTNRDGRTVDLQMQLNALTKDTFGQREPDILPTKFSLLKGFKINALESIQATFENAFANVLQNTFMLIPNLLAGKPILPPVKLILPFYIYNPLLVDLQCANVKLDLSQTTYEYSYPKLPGLLSVLNGIWSAPLIGRGPIPPQELLLAENNINLDEPPNGRAFTAVATQTASVKIDATVPANIGDMLNKIGMLASEVINKNRLCVNLFKGSLDLGVAAPGQPAIKWKQIFDLNKYSAFGDYDCSTGRISCVPTWNPSLLSLRDLSPQTAIPLGVFTTANLVPNGFNLSPTLGRAVAGITFRKPVLIYDTWNMLFQFNNAAGDSDKETTNYNGDGYVIMFRNRAVTQPLTDGQWGYLGSENINSTAIVVDLKQGLLSINLDGRVTPSRAPTSGGSSFDLSTLSTVLTGGLPSTGPVKRTDPNNNREIITSQMFTKGIHTLDITFRLDERKIYVIYDNVLTIEANFDVYAWMPWLTQTRGMAWITLSTSNKVGVNTASNMVVQTFEFKSSAPSAPNSRIHNDGAIFGYARSPANVVIDVRNTCKTAKWIAEAQDVWVIKARMGGISDIPATLTSRGDGTYLATFIPPVAGTYDIIGSVNASPEARLGGIKIQPALD